MATEFDHEPNRIARTKATSQHGKTLKEAQEFADALNSLEDLFKSHKNSSPQAVLASITKAEANCDIHSPIDIRNLTAKDLADLLLLHSHHGNATNI